MIFHFLCNSFLRETDLVSETRRGRLNAFNLFITASLSGHAHCTLSFLSNAVLATPLVLVEVGCTKIMAADLSSLLRASKALNSHLTRPDLPSVNLSLDQIEAQSRCLVSQQTSTGDDGRTYVPHIFILFILSVGLKRC